MNARRFLGFCRRRVEGLCFLVLLPFLAIGGGVAVVWRIAHPSAPAGLAREMAVTCRRWMQFVRNGLRVIRQEWWVEFSLDPSWHLWRYMVLFEVFELLNLAEGPRTDEGRLPTNVLSVKLAHFGDALQVVPLLRGLRAALPMARSDLLLGPWCKELGQKIPYINETAFYAPKLDWFCRGTQGNRFGLFGEFLLLRRLRRRAYDAVIFTSNLSYVELLLAHALRPCRWVGTSLGLDIYPPYSVSKTVPYNSREYEATRMVHLLTLLNLPSTDDTLEYWVSDTDVQFRERLFAEHNFKPDDLMVVMAPGAGWPGKMWPCDRFAEVAEWLTRERRLRVVIVGAAGENELGACIVRRVPEAIDLVGQTSWGQLAGVLQRARLWIGNDSGSMHLAAALNVPTVALFGPTVVSKWAPRGEKHIVLKHGESCADCIPWHPRARCPHGNACMARIGVDEVKNAAGQLLTDAFPAN